MPKRLAPSARRLCVAEYQVRRFSRRRNLPNRHPTLNKKSHTQFNLIINIFGFYGFHAAVGPEKRVAETGTPRPTPEFWGASQGFWVPIRQVAGPRGTFWEPFGSRGNRRAWRAKNPK